MRNSSSVKVTDGIKTAAGIIIIAVMLPLLILNLTSIIREGIPSLFGVGYFLRGGEDAELYTVDKSSDYAIGDEVLYLRSGGYALGRVETISDEDGETYVAVVNENNPLAVSVLPRTVLQGKITGTIDGVGKAVAFLGKYQLAFTILAVSVAAIELIDIVLGLRKKETSL